MVPASFCISRRTAGETDAYRPLIFLNALIDSAVASNNRVELRATLEPDLPLFKLSALLEQLKAYDQNPKIHYPTDIPYERLISIGRCTPPSLPVARQIYWKSMVLSLAPTSVWACPTGSVRSV